MKITKYMGMAFAIAALAACSNDEDLTSSWQNDPTAMKVNATVGSGIFSRSNPLSADEATQKAFNSGDKISIAAGTQKAVTYTLTNGVWTPEIGKYLKWETNQMAITAYYPVVDGASAQAFTLPTNQSEKDKIVTADYMIFSGSKDKPANNGELTMEMARKMARVIVTIEKFNDQYGSSVPTVADVKIKSGAASYAAGATAGDAADVTPYVQNLNEGAVKVGTTYTALVIPTAVNTNESFVTMSVNGTTLRVKDIPAMDAGKSYTYNLTIGKDAITVGTVTVVDWTTGTIEGGEAKEMPTVSGSTISLPSAGILDNASLLKAIGTGDALTISGPMNAADFATLRDWAIDNAAIHPLKALDLSGMTELTEVPDYAFYQNSEAPGNHPSVTTLETVTLPTTVTKIGESAFFGCTALNNIDLSNVTAIGNNGFYRCTGLGVINAPKLKVLTNAFGRCGTVTEIDLPAVTGVEEGANGVFAEITVQPGGTINLPRCTSLGKNMFYYMVASDATLYLTAEGAITMHQYIFYNAFTSAPNLVLNQDKKAGGTGSPTVNGSSWGYQDGSSSLYSGWSSISYVDNDGNKVQ